MSGPTATVAGVSAPLEAGSLEIEEAIRERSVARFVVQDQAGANEYKRGEQVTIADSAGDVLYRGFIWNDAITRLVSTGETRHQVVATDNTYLVDKRIIAAAYAAQTLRQIVTDIVNDVLNEEGVAAWTHQWLECDGTADFALSDLDPAGTGDVSFVVWIRAADWTPAADEILGGHWQPTGNQRSWNVHIDTTGAIGFSYSVDGTAVVTRLSTATLASAIAGLTDGDTDVAITVEFDADNGASGHDVRFYWGTRNTNPYDETDVTWTQLGTTVTTAGTITRHNSTGSLVAGAAEDGTSAFDGRLYRADFHNAQPAAAANRIANPRFDQLPEWDIGDTAATDSDGNIWTLKPTAAEPVIDRTWTVDVGPTITIVFNYLTASKTLDLLAERTQFWWTVDKDKILRFHARSENTAPFAVDETNILKATDRVTNDHPNYRNTQFIRGGFDITASQTEIFVGDGERITFVVGYPVSTVPTIETNIAGGGYTTKTVGIKGVDTGKDFYWNKGRNEIVQDSGGTALTTADLLKVTYTGLVDLIIRSVDPTEVAIQAARESGSGIVESVLEDTNLEGRAETFSAAADLLAQFGHTLSKAQFAVDQTGLEPGQLVDMTLPEHGIAPNTDYLIERVTMTHRGADRYIWTVEAAEGPPERSWSEFFRAMAEEAGRIPTENISALATVTILETVSESVTIAEVVTATVAACDVPSTSLQPTTSRLPC